MRKYLPLLVLGVAGCSGSDEKSPPTQTDAMPRDMPMDVSAEAVAPPMMRSESAGRSVAAPGITPTAAPGVAFNYRYGFRLPAQRIAAVQEQHASACEKLGIDQCRITGMHYRLVNERDIEGMLAFKLDPAVARQFGKQGVDAVDQAEGMLVESEISGEDAGSQIAAATRTDAQLGEDLRKVEEQLARTGLRSPERAELQIQAQQLRESIRANRANRQARQESLAKTPVVFRYGSGDLVPGFDNEAPIRKALERAGENLVGGLAVFLLIAATLLPWALLALLGWWAVRSVRTKLAAKRSPEEPTPAEA
jgi:hypothetical protein